MNKTVLSLVIVFFAPLLSFGQNKYPAKVEAVLLQARFNRTELEKAISYFRKPADSLKLKATYFLIENMDIHASQTYYWADSLGTKIPFDELAYPDFKGSIAAFDSLKMMNPKIHPVPALIRDIDVIKADFLIDNTERAFQAWKHTGKYSEKDFNEFCEYILPYRISIEPLQDWRKIYYDKYSFISDSSKAAIKKSTIKYLISGINEWFTCTYNMEKRNEPLPRLGSLQLLMRKKGLCEDVAALATFALRSQGIPATVDVVPFWATSTGGHSLNTTFINNRAVPFDVLLKGDSLNDFIREPAKVFRITYSKQPSSLASLIQPNMIPPGALQTKNYIDVTQEYWKTRNVTAHLFAKNKLSGIVYACVLNGQEWKPVWWGNKAYDSVEFKNMCQGAVYLPMYYIGGKLRPAGYPVASGYNDIMELKPDTVNTHTITIKELENYLIFRPGKRYTLWYWSYYWKKIETKITGDNTKELVFVDVPKNALLLLKPEYSASKERPFIITENGERVWW